MSVLAHYAAGEGIYGIDWVQRDAATGTRSQAADGSLAGKAENALAGTYQCATYVDGTEARVSVSAEPAARCRALPHFCDTARGPCALGGLVPNSWSSCRITFEQSRHPASGSWSRC